MFRWVEGLSIILPGVLTRVPWLSIPISRYASGSSRRASGSTNNPSGFGWTGPKKPI